MLSFLKPDLWSRLSRFSFDDRTTKIGSERLKTATPATTPPITGLETASKSDDEVVGKRVELSKATTVNWRPRGGWFKVPPYDVTCWKRFDGRTTLAITFLPWLGRVLLPGEQWKTRLGLKNRLFSMDHQALSAPVQLLLQFSTGCSTYYTLVLPLTLVWRLPSKWNSFKIGQSGISLSRGLQLNSSK